MCLRRIAGGRAPRALTPPCPERRGPWEGGGARPATAHGPLLCASEDAEPPHCALWGLFPFRFTSPAPKANGCLQGSLGSLHTLKSLEFHVRSVSLMRPLLCTSAATAFVGPPSFLAGLCPRPSPGPLLALPPAVPTVTAAPAPSPRFLCSHTSRSPAAFGIRAPCGHRVSSQFDASGRGLAFSLLRASSSPIPCGELASPAPGIFHPLQD